MKQLLILIAAISLFSCSQKEKPNESSDGISFQEDLNFLRKHLDEVVLLGDSLEGVVVVSPQFQARVMTSSAEGLSGKSFGWINHELIASGKIQPHIHAVGGEERFWLGPEGGQFGYYFKKDAPFNFENWQVPAALDTEPFEIIQRSNSSATFGRTMMLENYSGNKFELEVKRKVEVLSKDSLDKIIGEAVGAGIKWVAYRTTNEIKNIGTNAWTQETGLPSIWILSMLNSSPSTLVGIPYKKSNQQESSPVNDGYFGKVPADRLKVSDSLVVFRADGNYRSKIGIAPHASFPIMTSYDPKTSLLTLACFDLPEGEKPYVNSTWQIQPAPFGGDAVNAYNDGPNDTGTQMGKFYELESSSPGAELKPGESLQHRHTTIHFTGEKALLDNILKKTTGLSLHQIAIP